MKKISLLAFSLTLAFSLSYCGGEKKEDNSGDKKSEDKTSTDTGKNSTNSEADKKNDRDKKSSESNADKASKPAENNKTDKKEAQVDKNSMTTLEGKDLPGDSVEGKERKTLIEGKLDYYVIKEGNGESPAKGVMITAHYAGWDMEKKKFDSSYDRSQPFQSPIGVGRLIKGWDEAILKMKKGEKWKLIIDPALAYGECGPSAAPGRPCGALIFDVELLDFK